MGRKHLNLSLFKTTQFVHSILKIGTQKSKSEHATFFEINHTFCQNRVCLKFCHNFTETRIKRKILTDCWSRYLYAFPCFSIIFHNCEWNEVELLSLGIMYEFPTKSFIAHHQ